MENTSTRDELFGSTGDVRAMYEVYPYPSPTAGDTLIEDVASSLATLFGNDPLEGRRILDAGCGTGHRLAAVARRYPKAQCLGVDMTAASIEVAKALTARHGLKNVGFLRSDLLDLRPERPFDVIVSSGVIHHLERPDRGLAALAALLDPDGVLVVWLYHVLGEHQRLLDRELALTLWDRASGLDQGLAVMRYLGFKLEAKRYGSSAAQSKSEVSQRSLDVDAYLHPIVNAYRFEQAFDLFRGSPLLRWAAINNVNLVDSSRLIDLAEVERGDFAYFCQKVDELFEAPALRDRFRKLQPLEKLRVLEIRLKPTGFTIVGGREGSYSRLAERIRGNVVLL